MDMKLDDILKISKNNIHEVDNKIDVFDKKLINHENKENINNKQYQYDNIPSEITINNTHININYDKDSSSLIVKILDNDNEIIRQIPPEQVIQFRK